MVERTEEAASPSVDLFVTGLLCPESAAQFGRACETEPGVTRVDLQYVTGRLRIWGDVAPSEITRIARRFGYETVRHVYDESDNLRERAKSSIGFWGRKTQTYLLILAALLVMGGKMVDVSGLTLPADWPPTPVELPVFAYITALVLAGIHPLRTAILSVYYGYAEMHMIIVLVAIGAAALSAWFDAAVLLILFSLGHMIEANVLDVSRFQGIHDAHPSTKLTIGNGGKAIARFFTPAMAVVALLVAAVPPVMFGASIDRWLYPALILLMMSRPGALVTAVPSVLVSAYHHAVRTGVFVKDRNVWDDLASVSTVALDQTGTLTEGHLAVVEIASVESVIEGEVLDVAAAILSGTEHPAAGIIVETATEMARDMPVVDSVVEQQGFGAEGVIHGQTYIVGNIPLMRLKNVDLSPLLPILNDGIQRGRNHVIIAQGEQVLGMISLADTVRQGSKRAVRRLKAIRGIKRIVMLTDEHEGMASEVATELGIDHFESSISPEEKVHLIESWRREGEVVAMVGDGVSERSALNAANVGISIGRKQDEVKDADVVVDSNELTQVPYIIALARKTAFVASSNLALAIFLKGAAIGLFLSGVLTLTGAFVLEIASSLIVTVRGAGINRRIRIPSKTRSS